MCSRTETCSPCAFQEEPLCDIPARRTLQQRQWAHGQSLSIYLLGAHPIKSTALLGPGMSGAPASPMLCSGKHEAQVPSVAVRIIAQDELWHDGSCGSARSSQGATMVVLSVCREVWAGGSSRRGQTHPSSLSSTLLIPKPDLNSPQAVAEALLSWVHLGAPHIASDTHPGI